MYARVNRFQDTPENVEASERFAEQEVVPQLEQIPGFLGLLSMIDRTTGQSLAITLWESEEAMQASESEADRVRSEIKSNTGAEIRAVERYEVTLRVGL